MSELQPPAGFYAAAGNWAIITDEWAKAGGSYGEAVIIDTVSDEQHKLILTETVDGELTMQWFRRINAEHYVAIPIYHTEEELPKDEDKWEEIFHDAIELAKAELIMAVAFWPRYKLEAEWLGDADLDLIRTGHANADDLDQETVEQRRFQIFGVTDILTG